MTPLFKKLNLKEQKEILILNAPASFEPELKTLTGISILREIKTAKNIDFSLAFITTHKELDAVVKRVVEKTKGDATLWFAYPKGTSKKYSCDFNRDTGWQSLGDHGFEGVRQVAIDEDWSALRFRRAEFIKTMKRDSTRALSTMGKEKLKNEF